MNIHLYAPANVPCGRLGQTPLSGGIIGRPVNDGAKRVVNISSAAQQLSSLQSGDADVNLEQVNALRAAIASGTLMIDTRRIADGLIASARELLQ